jgi:hypothetical protein
MKTRADAVSNGLVRMSADEAELGSQDEASGETFASRFN